MVCYPFVEGRSGVILNVGCVCAQQGLLGCICPTQAPHMEGPGSLGPFFPGKALGVLSLNSSLCPFPLLPTSFSWRLPERFPKDFRCHFIISDQRGTRDFFQGRRGKRSLSFLPLIPDLDQTFLSWPVTMNLSALGHL